MSESGHFSDLGRRPIEVRKVSQADLDLAGHRPERPSLVKTAPDDAARAHWRLHARLRGRRLGGRRCDGPAVLT
jgi:hypothetical protein